MHDEPDQQDVDAAGQASRLVRARIESVLDDYRPRLRMDGADVVLVDLSPAGELRIRVTGRHACCPVPAASPCITASTSEVLVTCRGLFTLRAFSRSAILLFCISERQKLP